VVRKTPVVIGVLMFLFGGVFTLQGLGYLQGSAMTGSSFWAVVGPVIAGLGVALVFVSFQNRRR